MKRDEYINSVLSFVKGEKNRRFIREELENHIDDEIEFYQSRGYDYEKACDKAIEAMGDSEIAGAQLGKLHSGKFEKALIFLCFFAYAGLFTILILFFFSWNPHLNIFNMLIEAVVFLFSAASLITALKLKNLWIASISFSFTLVYLYSKIYFIFAFPALLYSPLLCSDYFVFSFNVDDFVNLSGVENYVTGFSVLLPSIWFYFAWLSLYIYVYKHVFLFNRCKYSLKKIKLENKFNKFVSIFAVVQIFVCVVLCFSVFHQNEDAYFIGDIEPYYESVCILESDTPCDMEELFDNDMISEELSIKYDWWDKYAETRTGKFITTSVIRNEEVYNKYFKYNTYDLYGEYASDKKYIAVVPVHYRNVDIDGGYVTYTEPDFSLAEWKEVATTGEITGTLDTKDTKAHFYDIDVVNLNTDDFDLYMEIVQRAATYSDFYYSGEMDKYEFKRLENVLKLQFDADSEKDKFIYRFYDKDKAVIINSADKIIEFYVDGELRGKKMFSYSWIG